MLIFEKRKRQKAKKPNAAQRALAAEWERIKAEHTTPLSKGAAANGIKVKNKQVPVLFQPRFMLEEQAPPSKSLPEPLHDKKTGVKPLVDDLAAAKKALKGRVGPAFNKGGLQFLTDDELVEQRTGVHRRR